MGMLPVRRCSVPGGFTGQVPAKFWVLDNIGPFRISKEAEPGIPLDTPILSERLKELGYVCGLAKTMKETRGNDGLQSMG